MLKIPGLGTKLIEEIIKQREKALAIAVEEIDFIKKHEIQPLFYLDEDYPHRLKHFPDSPIMLYYKGNADLNSSRIVAVVGTRTPTEKGKLICEELIEGLRNYNVLVISGLAYGIDVTAHKKCLSNGMDTVGVLGHGLGRMYPAKHKSVAQHMVRQGGLLTEYVHSASPDREHFPMRNRIVAGLCDALIVVETAKRGGSIITAELANKYNKDVFAFPGRIEDKYSQGCNLLIKSHKAALIESAADIGYVLRWEEKDSLKPQPLFERLNAEEQSVIKVLKDKKAVTIDELSLESELSSPKMASTLLQLEFKGFIKSIPGKRYMIVRNS